jgi:RNA polymerase sigma factor for flagellar operon FliA
MQLSHEERRAADRLVSDNLGLIQHVVAQITTRYPRHVDREELWNAGALGLVDASRRYDPDQGIPFVRYAVIRIRGAIIDSTRSRDWATRSTRRAIREERDATDAVRAECGRTPTADEVAARLGVDVERLAEVRSAAANANLLHLDQRVGSRDGDQTTLTELIEEDDQRVLPDASLERRELTGTLRVAIETLPPVQREVLTRYYFRDEYLREVAASLGVTEARASQIRAEALTTLRAYFAAAFGGTPRVDPAAPGSRARTAFLEEMASATQWQDRLAAADRPLAGLAARA